MARQSESEKTVRYAVVGLGHIAQVAVLPAFRHARRNSRVTAVVTGDRQKRRMALKKHGVEAVYSYEEYDACLEQVDAVYIALPNSMHAEYTIRAARAGVHVLCEKPMAVTAEECEQMIAACDEHRVKLMIAYRLHFEELTLGAIDVVRRGRIGEPRFFNASFSMSVRPGNIRTKRAYGGGSIYDIGVYCINAARMLFGAEPTEVLAMSVHSGAAKLAEVDETSGALLRFDEGRMASFVTSFNAADVGNLQIVGTKGDLRFDPAYEYAEALAYTLTVNGKSTRVRGRKRDQFAPELLYFSDCILQNRQPEPSGLEGLQDVRIVQAVYESAEIGKPVAIPPIDEPHPRKTQQISRPPVKKPRLVKVASASQ